MKDLIKARIEGLQVHIEQLKTDLKQLEIKLDVYSRTDRLAYGVWYRKYQSVDSICLDLMTEVRELETELEIPELPIVMEDQAVS